MQPNGSKPLNGSSAVSYTLKDRLLWLYDTTLLPSAGKQINKYNKQVSESVSPQ